MTATFPRAETDPLFAGSGATDDEVEAIRAALAAKAVSQSGTLAARPAAVAGNLGLLYFATDDNGGTLYRSDGSAWAIVGPRGIELAHAQTDTSYTTASLAAGAIEDTALSITFTPRDRPVLLESGSSVWVVANAAARPRQVIRKSDGTVVALNGYNAANTNVQQGPRNAKRLVPGIDITEGVAVTYKLSLQNAANATASTITIFSTANGGTPYFLRATEV